MDRRLLAVERQAERVIGEQARGSRPVFGGLGVADGLGRQGLLGEPAGGPAVQIRDLGRRGAAQLDAQQIAEEVVVAEPRPFGVQRDDKCVCVLERLEGLPRADLTAQ